MLTKEIDIWLKSVIADIYVIEEITGRANSKIFKIITKGQNYALKLYPSKEFDKRERLLVEFDALTIFHENKIYNTPKAIAKNFSLNVALYEWVDGIILQKVDVKEVLDASNFIQNINKNLNFKQIPADQLASEACLSTKELIAQIDRRFSRLLSIDIEQEPELHKFLNEKFKPVFENVKKGIFEGWKLPWSYDKDLKKEFQILSPSDFGFHNAIHVNNEIIYIDFEYFGWDDPVKLTSDFIWHAGMDVSDKAKNEWLEIMRKFSGKDLYFLDRFKINHPIFGLRWSMILLNEFIPKIWENRKHADKNKLDNH